MCGKFVRHNWILSTKKHGFNILFAINYFFYYIGNHSTTVYIKYTLSWYYGSLGHFPTFFTLKVLTKLSWTKVKMDEKKGNLKKMLSWSDSSDSDSDEEDGIKKGTSIVWVCNSYSCQIIHSLTNSYKTLVC